MGVYSLKNVKNISSGSFIGNGDYFYGRSGKANLSDTLGEYRGPGSVIQVQTAQTTADIQYITSSVPVKIAGLEIDFQPVYASSKILIKTYVATNGRYVSSYGIYRDNSPTCSTSGYTNRNAPNMQTTFWWFMAGGGQSTNTNYLENVSVFWSEDASSTTARTYDVRALSSWSTANYQLILNNRASNDMASFSFLSVMEVAQ